MDMYLALMEEVFTSNPSPDKRIYKAGVFEMAEMEQLVPKTFGIGF